MWKLSTEENNKRVYTNEATGSKCVTSKVYTDKDGNEWYGFEDMMSIPYTRQFASTKISSLYALGLSKDDLDSHIGTLKTTLKSNDPEKYEKAYASVLDFESKAKNATDAIKQISSLVCVYNLLGDEPIDSFEQSLQIRKMSLLENDPEAHSFFLNRQIAFTENYTRHLNLISQIVSQPLSGMSALSD
jgi:hypothetical protein